MTDVVLLRSMQHFARHFMGTRVRDTRGNVRGILLLDSEHPDCPFPANKDGGRFGQALKDLAVTMGKLITWPRRWEAHMLTLDLPRLQTDRLSRAAMQHVETST